MATTQNKSAKVSKAFGQELDKEYTFTYSYDELAASDEVPADEALTAEDILGYINARRNAAARAKAQSELFDSLGVSKPKLLDTVDGRIAGMVKILVAAGNTVENATAMARQVLGVA